MLKSFSHEDKIETTLEFLYNERHLRVKVSQQKDTLQVTILEQDRIVSRPVFFASDMVSSSKEAAEAVLCFVCNNMLEISAPVPQNAYETSHEVSPVNAAMHVSGLLLKNV